MIEVEDVHWADSNSLGFLRYLIRRMDKDQILLIISVREEEIGIPELGNTSDIASFLLEMYQEEVVEIIPIHPLDSKETIELLSKGLGNKLDISLNDEIFLHAEGNPMYTIEWARHLAENGLLEEREGVVSLKGHMVPMIPSTLNDVVMRRLCDLDQNDLKLINTAAVIGIHFPLEWLNFGIDEGNTGEAAISRRIARMKGTLTISGGEISFVHELIRRVVYDNIPWKEKVAMHLKLANWFESNELSCHPSYISDQF